MKNLMPPFPVYERIRLLRLFSGLSQIDMAKLLKGSQAWLSKVESGKLEISAQHLFLLRSVFGVSSDAILDGMIPYHEVALRMNPEALLPAAYTTRAKIPVKVIYPVIIASKAAKNVTLMPLVSRHLRVKTFVFADPLLLINEGFLLDFFRHPKMLEFFDHKGTFESLKKEIVKGFAPLSVKQVTAHGIYDEQFIDSWIDLLKTAPFEEDNSASLSFHPIDKPIFRSTSKQIA